VRGDLDIEVDFSTATAKYAVFGRSDVQQQRQPQVLRLALSRIAQDDTSILRIEGNKQLQKQKQLRNAGVLPLRQAQGQNDEDFRCDRSSQQHESWCER
jgi:hypothetical protein